MTGAYKVHPTKHPSLPPMPCSTFTTSGLVRCVRLGPLPREGSAPLVGGGVDFSSLCVGLSHLVCLLCCRVWELPGIGLLLLASSSIFNTSSSHFPVALLVLVFWVTNVHFPRTRCRLLSGVLTWLLLRGWPSYMGKLLYLF